MTITITISASVGTPSTTVETKGALDYDVTLQVGDVAIDGEVTLCPSHYDGTITTWGSLDHWATGRIVDVLLALDDGHERAVVIDAIRAECVSDAGSPTDLDIEISKIDAMAREHAEADVREVCNDDRENQRLHGDDGVSALRRAQASSHLGWDESARSCGLAQTLKIPPIFAEAYYTEYARRGAEYAAQLIDDADADQAVA